MTTKIFLVRHAEAEGNLFRVAHGQYDSNLTPGATGSSTICGSGSGGRSWTRCMAAT